MRKAWELSHPGADESDILSAMQGAVFSGGGDYPGNEFIIGSGSNALLCRYFSGRRKLDPVDQTNFRICRSIQTLSFSLNAYNSNW